MSEPINAPTPELKKQANELEGMLANIQTLAEETKGSSAENKEKIDKIAAEFKAKFEAMDAEAKDLKAKNDNIQAAFNRIPTQMAGKSIDDPRVIEFNKAWGIEMKSSLNETPIDVTNTDEFKKLFEMTMVKGVDGAYQNCNDDERKKLNTIFDSQGGVFVVPQYMPQPIEKQFDENGILRIVETQQTASPVVHQNIDFNDYSDGDFSHELTADDLDVQDNDFYQLSWTLHDMYYVKEFTRNELEDAAINIEQYIMRKLREGLERRKAQYLLLGNGVKVPKGLLTYPDGTNYDQIKQTTSELTAKVTWTDIFKLPKEVITRKGQGKYLMHNDVFYDLLSDTDGMGKYQIGNQIQFFSTQDVTLSILGKELVFDANMPTPASGSLSVVYGRFDEAYGVKTKPGQSIIMDDTKAKKITRTLRERMDGKLKNGQHLSILKCKA